MTLESKHVGVPKALNLTNNVQYLFCLGRYFHVFVVFNFVIKKPGFSSQERFKITHAWPKSSIGWIHVVWHVLTWAIVYIQICPKTVLFYIHYSKKWLCPLFLGVIFGPFWKKRKKIRTTTRKKWLFRHFLAPKTPCLRVAWRHRDVSRQPKRAVSARLIGWRLIQWKYQGFLLNFYLCKHSV